MIDQVLSTVAALALFMAMPAAADDIPRLRLASEPAARETWSYREVWRIDTEDPASPLVGMIMGATSDVAGNTYLVDFQLAQVLVVSPAGDLLATLSRQGEGPGEVTMPSSVILLSEERVGIVQGYPGKIVVVGRDGTPQPSIRLNLSARGDQPFVLMALTHWNGRFLVAGSQFAADGEWLFLAGFAADGREVARWAEQLRTQDMRGTVWRINEAQEFFQGGTHALAPDGTVYLAPHRDRYEIQVATWLGERLRILERDLPPRARTAADYERLKGNYSVDRSDVSFDFHFESHDPAIQHMFFDASGGLWITTCYADHDLPPGIARRFDLIDPDDGSWKEVALELPYARDRDGLYVLPDGDLLRIQNASATALPENLHTGADEEGGSAARAEDDADMGGIAMIRYTRRE